MSRDEVFAAVTGIVAGYQTEEDDPLTPSTVPINSIEGFDSLIAIECVAILEEKLRHEGDEIELPDSLFMEDEKLRQPSIDAIVDQVVRLLNTQVANHE